MNESGEMYLETILILSRKNPIVRSVDIAEYMNYSKASVSRAMGLLKKEGFINIDANGYITLSVKGDNKAKNIFEKHTVLAQMLMSIGVDEQTATKDACKMEHVISDKSLDAIKTHLMIKLN